MDLQFANGPYIDSSLQGGAMVNNDVMEYSPNHNEPYLAKAFYEHTVSVLDEYILTIDIGKFGVNDFFDVGVEVSDQTANFICYANDITIPVTSSPQEHQSLPYSFHPYPGSGEHHEHHLAGHILQKD